MVGLYDGRRAMVGDQGGVSVFLPDGYDVPIGSITRGPSPTLPGFVYVLALEARDTVRVSERCWRR